ncbi:dehydrogenase/reductase SDR family member on chromosome X-like isoform X1 [Pistacia vera]|uniref:dehydrogenase/reductase SDR family member on chromosome X-like isoform X1 n=1 Tax=Pistacia vera TaxID=55513 RepID=UPI0012637002|nr:dehydrogenase/reductase SDR family member on chromosome X-like isoform X1 [Pistacia vera]XP_031274734.1 dehydrogenase/reductase SDR family member on chromosome X-like isoform X1 [Pistacia vera]XP_031274735.1 dehydrogenase/reductase SDR family member on chromosome X-like isoform X1 [Pistacia vera]
MKELKGLLHFICSVQFWRMVVLWTVSVLTSYWQLFVQSLFSQKSDFFTRHLPPTTGLTRPVCVITGATSGLGAAAAYALSKEGFSVVLAGRSSHSLSKTMKGILSRNKDAHVKAFQVDLSSFQSIFKFKDSLQQWLLDSNMHFSIQLLINNAGILATSSRLSSEGHDQMMSANYIGAFSLTKLLLPLLRNSPVPSRIVNVTSFTHRNVFGAQIDNETVTGKCFLRSKDYPFARVYEFSKLCLLLFTYELHRQLGLMDNSRHVSVIAADPGVVKTNIMREVPSSISHVAFIVLKLLGLLQLPENGINSILDAALSPPETSGVYFFGGKGRTVNSSAQSYNSRLAEELWTTSCHLYEEYERACKELSK